jgi:hypothetical protein
MAVASYCPDEVMALVAGFIPLSGFVDGTFIEITKDVIRVVLGGRPSRDRRGDLFRRELASETRRRVRSIASVEGKRS